ncbi:DUF502 domain-containing protein [Parafilimonas sp.]|uniref:DUF502 domain-containing protein n=1 Tax=Parafilimonas sp. TaxID=1969739 RepID=UPI003F8157FC
MENSPEKFSFRHVLQYFFQGIIVIAPIAITIYVVVWLFNLIDNFLPDILFALFPKWMTAPDGSLRTIPGLGFLMVVIIVTVIGFISTSFFVSRILSFLNRVLEQTPGIKYIYSAVKDFLEAFGGNRKKFDKPVLVSVDATDTWRVGFITQHDVTQFGLEEHVAVYVPLSYALTGVVYFVPKEKIRPLDNMNSAEAMKFVISGGVTHLEENEHV